jgi:SAM-dependent methyltransferase
MAGMSTLLTKLDAFDDLPQATVLRECSYRNLGHTVVDVGCGSGRAVGELLSRGVRAIGVDLDPAMVEVARERWPEAEFHVADAAALPFADGSVTGYRAAGQRIRGRHRRSSHDRVHRPGGPADAAHDR